MSDWSARMPDVLARLEADGLLPSARREHGREIRYGKRGSLSVKLAAGTFFDHEAGIGGGVLRLVEHCTGRDQTGALEYLADAGIVERGGLPPEYEATWRRMLERRAGRPELPPAALRGPGLPETPTEAPSARPARPAAAEAESRRVEKARRLLAASERLPWPDEDGCPVEHPAFRWRRCLLLSVGIVEALRWLPADALPVSAPGAAGALLTPRAPLADWLDAEKLPRPSAVEVEYVGPDGGPVEDAGGLRKRTYGVAAGTVWSTGPCRRGRLHLAEGVADALSIRPHLRAGEDACATGGTSGLAAAAQAAAEARRALVLHADEDGPGGKAAKEARQRFRLLAPGVEVRLLHWRPDPDAERRAARDAGKHLHLPPWLYQCGEAAADASTVAPTA